MTKKILILLLLFTLYCKGVIELKKSEDLDIFIENQKKEITIIEEKVKTKKKLNQSLSFSELDDILVKLDLTKKTLDRYSYIIKKNESLEKSLKECEANKLEKYKMYIYIAIGSFLVGLLFNFIAPILWKIVKF